MIVVREATARDVEAIRDVFQATYGRDYPYQQFYDLDALTRLVYNDQQLLLVAEDVNSHRVVGTASVVLEVGALSDLVAEFGRLAVLPSAQGVGFGRMLMNERLHRVRDRMHVALVEVRLARSHSLRIAETSGFVPVGLLPLKMQMEQRENFCLLAQYFGDALSLRRNHPHVIPEVYPLAQVALAHCSLPGDTIVDDSSPAYPEAQGFVLRELTTDGYATLLRIERGRVRHREIFGPLQLHHGLFKLRAEQSQYLLALDHERIVGAIGWTQNPVDPMIRVFELIALNDAVARFLLAGLERTRREEGRTSSIEVDVSAYAPRMQRTLLELGFLPSAYLPAMVFSEVERLDIVRMVKLFVPPEFSAAVSSDRVRALAEVVLPPFFSRHVLPEIERAVSELPLFRGLDRDQVRRLASACRTKEFAAGEPIIDEHGLDRTLYILLDGEAAVSRAGVSQVVGIVRAGECLGEMSMLTGQPHSASARATRPTKTATLTHGELTALVRLRPDVGLIVFRNLAIGLGAKLGRAPVVGVAAADSE